MYLMHGQVIVLGSLRCSTPELTPHMAGREGFEPPTFGLTCNNPSQSARAILI